MVARRNIGELLARCRLEPDTKDVFVEGDLDKALIERFLKSRNLPSTGVFKVETIEVPSDILLPHERGSHRGRLCALARTLEHELGDSAPVRCIIDQDFDFLLGSLTTVRSELLLTTDRSTIEMYFFDPPLLQEILSGFFRNAQLDASQMLSEIADALISTSNIFATNQSLQLGCSPIPLSRCSN